jgi:hypothetical protein
MSTFEEPRYRISINSGCGLIVNIALALLLAALAVWVLIPEKNDLKQKIKRAYLGFEAQNSRFILPEFYVVADTNSEMLYNLLFLSMPNEGAWLRNIQNKVKQFSGKAPKTTGLKLMYKQPQQIDFVWQFDFPHAFTPSRASVAMAYDAQTFFVVTDKNLTAVEKATANLRWDVPLPAAMQSSKLADGAFGLVDKTLVLAKGAYVAALAAEGGRVLWQVNTQATIKKMWLQDTQIMIWIERQQTDKYQAEIWLLETKSGKVTRKIPLGQQAEVPLNSQVWLDESGKYALVALQMPAGMLWVEVWQLKQAKRLASYQRTHSLPDFDKIVRSPEGILVRSSANAKQKMVELLPFQDKQARVLYQGTEVVLPVFYNGKGLLMEVSLLGKKPQLWCWDVKNERLQWKLDLEGGNYFNSALAYEVPLKSPQFWTVVPLPSNKMALLQWKNTGSPGLRFQTFDLNKGQILLDKPFGLDLDQHFKSALRMGNKLYLNMQNMYVLDWAQGTLVQEVF